MLTLRSKRWRHEIDEGTVTCELRDRGVALEHCLECPWLLDAAPGEAFIWCRPDAARHLAERAIGP